MCVSVSQQPRACSGRKFPNSAPLQQHIIQWKAKNGVVEEDPKKRAAEEVSDQRSEPSEAKKAKVDPSKVLTPQPAVSKETQPEQAETPKMETKPAAEGTKAEPAKGEAKAATGEPK